jgi:lipid-binding SYLF domain-containing protein
MRAVVGFIAIASSCLFSCAHAPTHPGARADLTEEARKTLAIMQIRDPSLKPIIRDAAGYIVFPAVGKGGLIFGGGSGAGVLFENGEPVHFAELRLVEAGALVGGEGYSEVLVVRDPAILQSMKTGRYDFGANVDAIMLRSGAATAADFSKGTAVFVMPNKGMMLNMSLSAQRIRLTL